MVPIFIQTQISKTLVLLVMCVGRIHHLHLVACDSIFVSLAAYWQELGRWSHCCWGDDRACGGALSTRSVEGWGQEAWITAQANLRRPAAGRRAGKLLHQAAGRRAGRLLHQTEGGVRGGSGARRRGSTRGGSAARRWGGARGCSGAGQGDRWWRRSGRRHG